MTAFHDFLKTRCEAGGFTTEDVLASFLPLVRQVIAAHEAGRVAPLEGLEQLRVDDVRIWFEESECREPRRNLSGVRRLLKPQARAVEVIDEARVVYDVDLGVDRVETLRVAERGEDLERPAWLPGYVCWEHQIGHHDPLTDVFSLGLILASLGCSLDLTEPEDHAALVSHRRNLFALAPGLHPVLARAITAMTELDRHQRPQDLPALLIALSNYRDQEIDFDVDLASSRSFETSDRRGKRRVILGKLQERLFDISRRNRLLHFKPTMQTVNLTHASIPLLFDVRHVRDDQILTWNSSFRRDVLSLKSVSLNKYLNFREAVYLPGTLDRICAEARRDQNEYGFAQLRLVVCFLRWADLKAKPVEHYESPLLLLPVKLAVKKGIFDRYTLTALETEAEVNPVIRHLFKQLYDIDLPDRVDLTKDKLDEFYVDMTARIQASDAAVTLTKVDRPRIDLIHEKARRRLDQFRRHARLSGRGISQFRDLDYSYDPANYHPLGIRIFESLIRPARTHLEDVVSPTPRKPQYAVDAQQQIGIRVESAAAPVVEAEGEFYQVRERADDNPYHWEFDLCSVTLANLKYQRMSLVRDYTELSTDNTEHPAFEATFSIAPRETSPAASEPLPLAERFHVVSCDPTQAEAIALARAGTSYIIQGPPGTGKSQTITNLIADFVVRGQRVLFVCEKRAAIDVVYHRLKQHGLHELCCLIHDSQADKKAFVMDLKTTYETFLAEANTPSDQHSRRREKLLEQLERELRPLQDFDSAMLSEPATVGTRVRTMLNRLIHLRDHVPSLSPLDWERIPQFCEWRRHRPQLRELSDALREVQSDNILAHHSLRLLSGRVADVERPLNFVTDRLQSCQSPLERLDTALRSIDVPADAIASFDQLGHAVAYATMASFLARHNLLTLFDAESDEAKRFQKHMRKVQRCESQLAEQRLATAGWREKLSREELGIALDQARQLEGRLLSFLNPAWWRLRGVLRRAYDFSRHKVRTSWVRILQQLDDEYRALAQRTEMTESLREEFGFDDDFDAFDQQFRALHEFLGRQSGAIRRLHRHVIKSQHGNRTVLAFAALESDLRQLSAALGQFLDGFGRCSLNELRQNLQDVNDALDELPDYLGCLRLLNQLSPALAETIRTLPLTLSAVEAAAAERSLQDVYRADGAVAKFDGSTRLRCVTRLGQCYDDWQTLNAAVVRERVRQKFIESVNVSSKPLAQLAADEKEFKKAYSRGRRDVEHEFGKTMRYKSIRDLVAGESGLVVRDLKPVWLMSPLSVSDTLPLNPDSFDVVIFDEASQITLEEAVPSIFRARQTIVVGDEMQLPPTSFFMARRSEEDEELLFEEGDEVVQYDLNSNSFLNHAARNLPSRMLGWHYRSRSESLISFSNHAFYAGRLLTVPEVRRLASARDELRAEAPDDGDRFADELLERPVSFHFMEHGVYEKRRNATEAAYIARLVRRILERDEGHSIGIVAFSEAQQEEIENALQSLAADDKQFAERLELELEREVDDQFVGLLVKNLENIQGDERDVIILSVCYGPTRDGVIRMNFGPINVSGGEKRLNVAFSRAKHHMALVSSLRSGDITNDYNDGANCLKNYLRYAEASSLGKSDSVTSVLRTLSDRHESDDAGHAVHDAIVQQLTAALQGRGYQVDANVGQSHFRCDLAVSRPGDTEYRVGVLVDTAGWYSQRDLLERELMRPRLLQAFGWRLFIVLARDWYHLREETLEKIVRLLEGDVTATEPPDCNPQLEEADDFAATAAPPAPSATTQHRVTDAFTAQASEVHSPAVNDPGAPEPTVSAASTDEVSVSAAQERISQVAAWSRSLEFIGGGSAKFWQITVNGTEQTVRFGRIGSPGQTRTKTFPDHSSALADSQRQADRKQTKGYQDQSV